MDWMFLPLKRYADFRGRSRRKEYWMFALFLFLVYVVFGAVLGASLLAALTGGLGAGGLGGAGIGLILLLLFALAMFIPSLAVGVRRLHDIDRSGWWIIVPTALSLVSFLFTGTGIDLLLSTVSLIGSLVLLVFFCMEGTRGPNRFGPDPKDPAGANLQEVFR